MPSLDVVINCGANMGLWLGVSLLDAAVFVRWIRGKGKNNSSGFNAPITMVAPKE